MLYLGKSENSNKANLSKAILADSVEALIAAIYLDSNLEKAEEFITKNLEEAIKEPEMIVMAVASVFIRKTAKSIADKIDVGMIMLQASQEDKEALKEEIIDINDEKIKIFHMRRAVYAY